MSERVDILIPEDQREGTEIELGAWLKAVGDRVEENEPIAELVTDKAVVELPAPTSGTLAEILVEAETAVGPDAVLGRIDPSGAGDRDPRAPAKRAAPAPAAAPIAPAATPASRRSGGAAGPAPHPAVLRFAAHHGVELSGLTGTGAEGRVTLADVERATGTSRARAPTRAAGFEGEGAPEAAPGSMGPRRVVRHDPMRKAIARHMADSVRVAPHVTAVFECDLSRITADRDERKQDFASRGIKLTFTAYFLRALVEAVRAVPEVNARWRDDGLEIFDSVHVGVGTALEDQGLVVPVVRDVQSMDLEGTARALTEVTEKARAGRLTAADMKGSTITVSNHGVMGSLLAAPIIINQPESAILGLGKLEKRAKVVTEAGRDRVEVRPMLYVTLTIDHRALDAFHTNRFLSAFVEILEGWGAG